MSNQLPTAADRAAWVYGQPMAPCPVCGKQPKVARVPYFDGRWRAQCERVTKTADHCITADGRGADAAIKNWNRYVGRGRK